MTAVLSWAWDTCSLPASSRSLFEELTSVLMTCYQYPRLNCARAIWREETPFMKTILRTFQFTVIFLFVFTSGCQGCGSTVPDNPQGTVVTVAKELDNKNPKIIWEALPETYRNDINDVVEQFANSMDAELWEKSIAVAQKLATVARDKKQFILASPMMKQQQGKKTDILVKNWNPFMGMIKILVESESLRLENLKKFDGKIFLSQTGRDLMLKAQDIDKSSLGDAPKTFKDLKVETVVETERTASLQITFDGESQMLQMTRIEDRWVPKDLADNWQELMSDTKRKIDSLSSDEIAKQKPQIMMVLAAIDSGLDQLKMTKTQMDFDRTLQSLL
ncbi:MAG: hypothetical protein JXX14_06010, partial [Deltaproteobacteria bacterium]|nr:hypothetical protein [Deltaproteobacteria bacterium]